MPDDVIRLGWERASATGGVSHRRHEREDAPDHPQRTRPLAHVRRGNRGSRASVLPVHRGQGGAVRRPKLAPDLRRAGRPRHARALSQRHIHQPAFRSAVRAGAKHRGLRTGADHPARLRHRVRLLRPARARALARDEGGFGAVFCRPDQRHHGLRGSGGPGVAGGAERRAQGSGQRSVDAPEARGVPWRPR